MVPSKVSTSTCMEAIDEKNKLVFCIVQTILYLCQNYKKNLLKYVVSTLACEIMKRTVKFHSICILRKKLFKIVSSKTLLQILNVSLLGHLP